MSTFNHFILITYKSDSIIKCSIDLKRNYIHNFALFLICTDMIKKWLACSQFHCIGPLYPVLLSKKPIVILRTTVCSPIFPTPPSREN